MRLTDHFRNTRCIGITGGVGSGKTAVTGYLKEMTRCRAFYADTEAKKLYLPGSPVSDRLIGILGEDLLDDRGQLNTGKLASRIFKDKELLEQVNSVIHPAVKELILDETAKEKASGKRDFFFVEAALLVEEGYEEILDELWYVYSPEDIRRDRLKSTRGYSDEKIDEIFESQLSDKEYRAHCRRVIDNSGSVEEMHAFIDNMLKDYITL
ncbi:MAG: dephospho-CoA kinase [Lachnospiraceae bacterium]|nr:dephospho-CoA kinase [Lachnospiraceae bacterium]